MKRNLICIGCPMGCDLTVEVEDGKAVSVSGNNCAVGKRYAETEISAPTRMVTTTARVEDGTLVPVKTKSPVPKDKIFEVVAAIKEATVYPPVLMGEVILEDAAGTGVDVVTTAGLPD